MVEQGLNDLIVYHGIHRCYTYKAVFMARYGYQELLSVVSLYSVCRGQKHPPTINMKWDSHLQLRNT